MPIMPKMPPLNTVVTMNKSSLIILGVSLSVTSLACVAIGLSSGLTQRPGKLDRLSFAVVDSSKVAWTVNGNKFHGLPDADDFSKHKDFYAFYLWSYCSGIITNKTYQVNFCSKPGQSLFDLLATWKAWGVTVHKAGAKFHWLEHGSKLLYIAYLTAAGLKMLELVAGVPVLFSKKASRIVVLLSASSFITVLTTSILTQVTYDRLIRQADDDNISITAKKVGFEIYAVNWVATVLSLLAVITWHKIAFASTQIRRANTVQQAAYTPISGPRRRGNKEEEPYSPMQPLRRRTTRQFFNY